MNGMSRNSVHVGNQILKDKDSILPCTEAGLASILLVFTAQSLTE